MAATSRSATARILAAIAACCVLSTVAQGQVCTFPGTGNPTCGSDSASQSSPNPSTGVGNPIDLTSGNKYQAETDIAPAGDLSLGFRRHYNSLQSQTGVLGHGWSHTFETRLSRAEQPGGAGSSRSDSPRITITQGDGRQITFEPFETTAQLRRYRSIPAGYGLIEEDVAAVARARAAYASSRQLVTDQFTVWTWQWSDGRTLTFNGRGLLKAIERPDGHGLHAQFDAQRRLAKVTDSYGNWLTAKYWDDATERLQPFAAPNTRKRGGGYRGRLESLTLSSGEQLQYEYDPHGDLNDVVYSDGTVRRYEYQDFRGRPLLSRIFARDGRLAASFEYDASGHATRSTHPDHRDDVAVSYEWPKENQTIGHTTVENAAGEKTRYDWRADSQAQSPVILGADGPGCRTCATSNVRYEYDAREHVSKNIRVDAHGTPLEQVTTSVDELGRTQALEIASFVEGKLQPAHWRETREYVGNSLLPSMITRPSVAPGLTHTLNVQYNERGQPVRVTEKGYQFDEPHGMLTVGLGSWRPVPLERVTTLTYATVAGLSLLQSVDGPLPGATDTWTYQYDSGGRLRAVVHPGGIAERFERDAWGRITAHTGLDGVRETLEYGAEGRIAKYSRAGTWMTLGYDEDGRIARFMDSLGQQLTLTRNNSGEIVEIADPAGNRIRWDYGDDGEIRATSLLNPDGSLSQRGHTDHSLPAPAEPGVAIPDEAMLSPVAGALPDAIATMLPGSQDNASGIRTAYDSQKRATTSVYDDFGRLTAQHSPVSGTTLFRWDEADHLIERVASDDSVTRITRDALGRAIRVRAGPEDGRIEWGVANRPTRITFRAGEERFEYDSQAQLTAHTLLIDGKQFRITYEFDSLGRLLRKHLPDGGTLHYRYNGMLHPKPGVLAGIYKEGLVERPIVTDVNTAGEHYADRGFTFGNGLSQRQVLDVDGHLVSDGNPKVGQSRLNWSSTAGSPTYGSPVHYGRVTRVGEQASADFLPPLATRLAANISELGVQQDWNTGQEVQSAYFVSGPQYDARGQVAEDSQRTYQWDALGRLTRVAKRQGNGFTRTAFSQNTVDPTSTIAEYRYDLFGERVAKVVYAPTGPKVTYFLWDGTELAAEIDPRGKVRDYVYLDGRPVALLADRAIYAIHTDHRLAPVAVTDSNRRVVWQADIHDNGATEVSGEARFELPLRASNQYFDSETGLHYNLHRYLDARTGRYLSPDPLGLAAGPDVYQFAFGKPHAFVDLLGLQAAPTDSTNVGNWSFAKKLTAVFTLTAKDLPGDIGNELLNLVSPQNIGITVAIFAFWGASHAWGFGEAVDAIGLVVMYATLGKQAGEILMSLIGAVSQIDDAQCYRDLRAPAKAISKAISTVAGAVAQAVILHKLFGNAESELGSKAEKTLDEDVNSGQNSTLKPAPKPFKSISELLKQQSFSGKPKTSPTNVRGAGTKAVGDLGEQVAAEILEDQTGLTFRGIRNASNNGPDEIAVVRDASGKITQILHVEVKASAGGNPAWPDGSGAKKFTDWITEAANNGTIANKPISAADRQFARQLQDAMNRGVKVTNTVMQVRLPPPGTTGTPTATLKDWP